MGSGLAALLLLPRLAAAAAELPEPESLLEKVLNPPDIVYEGRTMVTQWFGKQARAEEISVYHAKGSRARREFIAPDGAVQKVIISDGEHEEVQLVKARRVFRGDATRLYAKVMPEQRERELLAQNYDLSVSTAQPVAGRPTWALELAPKTPGKPSQRIWIDQQTGVVLENKRFLPRRSFAAMSRFIRFQPGTDVSDSLFELGRSSYAAADTQTLAPSFLSLEQLNDATGSKSNFPKSLPGGFEFESADYLELGKALVRHARYTDGLAIVSIFQTDRRVLLPRQGTTVVYNPAQGASALRLSATTRLLNWSRGRQNYTIMGDVSRELLLSIRSSLR